VILFTSGTSAHPKGVVLNYREHLGNIDPTADGFGITADDRVYDFRSFNWASAQLLGALAPVYRGATLVMAERFSASRFFQHARDHRVTIAAGNPTTINIRQQGERASRQPAEPALHHVELGATDDRRVASLRGALRHPDRAGLWLERNRLDRRHSRRSAAARHGRAAVRLS
jgi:acyl-coenzyme A synthetase/AMP-(fatty) acid ligase